MPCVLSLYPKFHCKPVSGGSRSDDLSNDLICHFVCSPLFLLRLLLKLSPEGAEASAVVGAEPPEVGEHGVHEGDVARHARVAAAGLGRNYITLSMGYVGQCVNIGIVPL